MAQHALAVAPWPTGEWAAAPSRPWRSCSTGSASVRCGASRTRWTAGLLTAGRRELSLVDCVSFACMRRQGLTRAFHFDRHFREQGFASA